MIIYYADPPACIAFCGEAKFGKRLDVFLDQHPSIFKIADEDGPPNEGVGVRDGEPGVDEGFPHFFQIPHKRVIGPVVITPGAEWKPQTPDGFTDVDAVASHAEREAIVRGYASMSGFAREQVNARG